MKPNLTTKPKTPKQNVFFFNNFRISVLKEGLVRIEKDSKNKFNDEPTQLAWFRDFSFSNFKVVSDKKCLKIEFREYELVFNGDIDSSYILYKRNKIKIDNSENLMGTYGTVDGMNGDKIIDGGGNRQIGYGVCSKNGVAVIDDSNSYCFDENLEFSHKNNDEQDMYIFFYPNNYQGAVKALFDLAGYPPLLPKYAFGNWWSRYHAYSSEEYLYLMEQFRKENIPFTVATIDMDWHYSNWANGCDFFTNIEMPKEEFIQENTGKFIIESWNNGPWSIGWTGFTWNKKLFPDYKATLKELRDKGLHVTLNLHPADGIAFYEDCYEPLKKKLNLSYKEKETIPFDLTDKAFKEAFFNDVLGGYQKDGVDFWWVDWQQGENSKLPGLSPMWLCNHYFCLENGKFNDKPLILSRFAGVGSHRYPLGFSGDSHQTYDSLKYLIKTTSMASNVGFTYWSHDIGGHMHGYKDGEQFLKFIQFGIFSPINRLHCSCEEMFDKNPLLFLKGNRDIIKHFLRLRHQMIPYLYSFTFETNEHGYPLCKPLYYNHPNDELSFKYANKEYFFANDILIRPFSEPANENGLNKVDMYFPEGEYYDLFYGYHYKGDEEVIIYRENESVPAFIKKGAFFVLDARNTGNDIDEPQELNVITSIGNGEYIFHEDSGVTTFLNKEIQESEQLISISCNHMERRYNFKILNLHKNVEIKVSDCELLEKHECGEFLEFSVFLSGKTGEITLKFNPEISLDIVKNDLIRRLSYLDDFNDERQKVYRNVMSSKSINELESVIKESKLQLHNQMALLELII